MCGIAGFISSEPLGKNISKKLCTALLYYSQSRGQQSAGLFINNTVIKKATAANNFIQSSEFHNAFTKPASCALMHTRQPTSGGTSAKHAQPFRKNDTITIHNGFYSDCEGIKSKWGLTKSTNVDSELVTQFIETYGIERLPEFIESTDGPSAIAAIYRNNLYLYRSSNPTSFTTITTPDNKTILIFASTKEILTKALLHCWLIPDSLSSDITREGILFHATPFTLTALTETSVTHTSKWGNFRHRGNYNDRYLGDADDEEETIITKYKKYLPDYKPHEKDCNCISCKLPHTNQCICHLCEVKRAEILRRQGNLNID
jgi:asparagine synthetase B (glutamine-hydrolysing)